MKTYKQTNLNKNVIFFNAGLFFECTELVDQGFLLCQFNIKNKYFPVMLHCSWEL